MENNLSRMQINRNNRKKKKNKIIVLLLSIFILAVGFLYTFNVFRVDSPLIGGIGENRFKIDPNAREGNIQVRDIKEVEEELNRKVQEGMINISMNMTPVFNSGNEEGNLLIVNESINLYPQVVEIYLDETQELIYQSGLIPVGSRVENSMLDVSLDKGTYKCTAFFNSVDTDTNEYIGKAGANITISVLN